MKLRTLAKVSNLEPVLIMFEDFQDLEVDRQRLLNRSVIYPQISHNED